MPQWRVHLQVRCPVWFRPTSLSAVYRLTDTSVKEINEQEKVIKKTLPQRWAWFFGPWSSVTVLIGNVVHRLLLGKTFKVSVCDGVAVALETANSMSVKAPFTLYLCLEPHMLESRTSHSRQCECTGLPAVQTYNWTQKCVKTSKYLQKKVKCNLRFFT